MRIVLPNGFFVGRKIMAFRLLGDASLQSTLYRIPSQVISPFILFTIKQYLSLAYPQLCQLLKISAVHSFTSVSQRVNRRGDATAAAYEGVGGEFVDGHDGGRAEEAAELDRVADIFSRHGDDAHRGRLVVRHADGHLVGDDGGDGLSRRRAGHGHHVNAYGADARPRFQFVERERAVARRAYHPVVLRDRDERPAHPAHRARSHRAALLYGVGEERKRGGRAVRARALETQSLDYLRD